MKNIFIKYLERKKETIRLIERIKKNITQIEEERRQLIKEEALSASGKTEIQQSRRMRGCPDRLAKEEKNKKTLRQN